MTILERWFEEVWNQGREEAIDELSHPAGVAHGLAAFDGSPINNLAGFKIFYRDFRAAFTQIHVDVEDTVTEGDKTVARCRVKAVNTGPFLGNPATHKPVEFTGMSLAHVRDGKIDAAWNSFDFAVIAQQLA